MTEKTKQYWSMMEGVFNCLIDEERTKAFEKAILNTVKKGDIVVDMGTGSGFLAMLAVRKEWWLSPYSLIPYSTEKANLL